MKMAELLHLKLSELQIREGIEDNSNIISKGVLWEIIPFTPSYLEH